MSGTPVLRLHCKPLLVALGSAWALTGCGDDGATGPTGGTTTPEVATVEVTPGSYSFNALSAQVQFSAVARDASGSALTGIQVDWVSSDPGVAFVSADGLVTAEGNGSAIITATAQGVEGSSSVLVAQVLAAVELTPSELKLLRGSTEQVSAMASDSLGRAILSDVGLTWSSSDATVATVEGTSRFGVWKQATVTPIGIGTATISAAADGKSATTTIAVIPLQYQAVDPGAFHTCGVTGGPALCWGEGGFGRLGTGDQNSSSVPRIVSGGLNFTEVKVGFAHSCGLAADGAAHCWGFNFDGQLGDGTTENRTTPVAVSGGLRFSSLSGSQGALYSCGLTAAGRAYCWGDNSAGQLGNGGDADSSTPAEVSGGRTFSSISVGSAHTCALTTAGAAYCWGLNREGQLGNGNTNDSRIPVAVSGGLTFAAISTEGLFTCGLTDTGAIYCWGANDNGQLGTGDTAPSTTPAGVAGGLTFTSVATGAFHTCAIADSGAAYCWGANNFGQLGTGDETSSTTPVAVSGGLTFSSLSGGGALTCGISATGVAYCWGFNGDGQLGDGTTEHRSSPVQVVGQEF